MKHCIQNIINTSQKQINSCVFHRELCVVFHKKCFMKLKTLSQRLIISVWFCRFGVCVLEVCRSTD